jgi:hypothetical protein
MRRSNALQEQANAISSAMVARAGRQDAPFLVATPGAGGGTRGGSGEQSLIVQNRGGGLARDIEIETAWGPARLESLGTGDEGRVNLILETGYDPPNTRPDVIRFTFRDATGTAWEQLPNQLPEHRPNP